LDCVDPIKIFTVILITVALNMLVSIVTGCEACDLWYSVHMVGPTLGSFWVLKGAHDMVMEVLQEDVEAHIDTK
jgi:hypothetical protein